MECNSCHMADFNQTTNPNHNALGLSTACESCHTTDPGWSATSFINHDDFYVLDGAHAAIANDCAACHNSESWDIPQQLWVQMETERLAAEAAGTTKELTSFDHNTTAFPLDGSHQGADCRACHASLIFEEADTVLASAHAVYTSFVATDNPSAIAITDAMGVVAMRLNRFEEADSLLNRAHDVRLGRLGPDHLYTRITRANLEELSRLYPTSTRTSG